MNARIPWQSMGPVEAKIEADKLHERMTIDCPKLVEHFNREAVRYQNQELPDVAYLQELQCMERSVFEMMKVCSLYLDIYDIFQEHIGNKEEIGKFISDTGTGLMRFLGNINRHYKILETK